MESKRKMREIRCPVCNKKLGYTNGDLETKCSRTGCGLIVTYSYNKNEVKTRKDPPRETSSGKTFYY